MRLRGFSYTWRRFSGAARFRAFWHRHVRGYEAEVCQRCGRPVGCVWWCHDDLLWEYVTGEAKPPGREAAGGVRCISCFDRAVREFGTWIEWAPLKLRHLDAHGEYARSPSTRGREKR